MLGDIASLLQASPDQLKTIVEQNSKSQNGNFSSKKANESQTTDEQIFNWLKSVPRLKANCDKAAKEQKERRGRLKSDIQTTYYTIKNKPFPDKEKNKKIKQILKSSQVNDAFKLYEFCERAKKIMSEDCE